MALSVVIPAYNEAERLPRTLRATIDYLEGRGEPYEILVVDDGSRDATAEVAASVGAEQPLQWGRVTPLRYELNRGKGHAVRYGVLRSEGARVLVMDADLATPLEEFEKLSAALSPENHIEVAIGSRPLKESQLLVRQPWYREMCGRCFNVAVQMLSTPGIYDTQCGFKLFLGDAAREIFSRCTLDGFSYDVESIYLARKLGYGIAEVPVRWEHQEGAAAFATRGQYLHQGLQMVRDLFTIRHRHRSVRPVTATVPASPRPLPPS